eukprot:jgi/Tetstr1/454885/TSEL_041749.t1
MARRGDYMLAMDLHDGFYAVGIAPEDSDYFTIDYRDKLYRLAGLPMGWSLSPYYFCSPTAAFNRHLRRPDFTFTSHGVRRSKLIMGPRHPRRMHFCGGRMLPYMDDIIFFASSRARRAYDVHDERLTSIMLGKLGLNRHHDKSQWEPI